MSALKVSPQRGMRPSLEYRPIADLLIDATYQRSIDTGPSQKLIRTVARDWDWGLCQPLVVAKREDGSLWVIDGQHRLAAARLRADIYDLPCVVLPSRSADDEAKAFVALNQQRRALTTMDLFKAALLAGNTEAVAIRDAMDAAGLTLANTSNTDSWKPMQIINIGGMQRCYRSHGDRVLRASLAIGAQGFAGQQLRYFGTIFPGIAAAVAKDSVRHDADMLALIAEVLGGGSQQHWLRDIRQTMASGGDLNMREAAVLAVQRAVDEALSEMEG